jgi:hypothetical protein
MEHVRCLAIFIRESGKRLTLYEEICQSLANSLEDEETRWLLRVRGLRSWINNWRAVKLLLESVISDNMFLTDARQKAKGLMKCMLKFSIYWGCKCLLDYSKNVRSLLDFCKVLIPLQGPLLKEAKLLSLTLSP